MMCFCFVFIWVGGGRGGPDKVFFSQHISQRAV